VHRVGEAAGVVEIADHQAAGAGAILFELNAVEQEAVGDPAAGEHDVLTGGKLLSFIDLVRVADASRYGTVVFDENHVVGSFHEKYPNAGPGWINAGMSLLRAEDFSDWDRKPFSIEEGVFPRLASSGKLRAVPLDPEFIDIGIPEDYYRFCRWIESHKSMTL